jgi:hypothetical protein
LLLDRKYISFYSEFHAHSEYVILFQKYFGQKIGLIDIPFQTFSSCSSLDAKEKYLRPVMDMKNTG